MASGSGRCIVLNDLAGSKMAMNISISWRLPSYIQLLIKSSFAALIVRNQIYKTAEYMYLFNDKYRRYYFILRIILILYL